MIEKRLPAYLPKSSADLDEFQARLAALYARLTELEAALLALKLDFEQLANEFAILRESA